MVNLFEPTIGPIKIIEQAISKAKESGLLICRGPLFIWTGQENSGRDKILGCDGTGAVLWVHDLHKSEDRVKHLCRILNVDTWWLHRFWFGWSQQIAMNVIRVDCFAGFESLESDEVSKKASQISKKYSKTP